MTRAKQHPTGIAGLAFGAVVLILARFHVELTQEEVAVYGALFVAAVSALSPRNV